MTRWLTEPAPLRDRPEPVSPGVLRLVAANPGAFTYHGTNTWLVGTTTLAVIDPGPEDPAHRSRLLEAIGGRRVAAILVTHGHADHWPGAAGLAQATGAKVLGFASSGSIADAMEEAGALGFRPDATLAEGDTVDLDGARLRAIHTPGHRFDHLCFALDGAGVLFTGDHVMGWSSSIVSPPEGDMAACLASLRRLRGRDDRLWLPGHGPAIPDPAGFLEMVIGHRETREVAILEALRRGDRDIAAIVSRVYAETPPHLHAAAARSVLAHLIALVADSRVLVEAAPAQTARYRLP